MKTLESVEKELKFIVEVSDRERNEEVEVTKVVLNRRRKRLQFLKVCRNYLDSGATRDFLLSEKKRLENRLEIIMAGFDAWAKTSTCKEPLKEYNKIMDTKTIKEHLKTIKYLLN